MCEEIEKQSHPEWTKKLRVCRYFRNRQFIVPKNLLNMLKWNSPLSGFIVCVSVVEEIAFRIMLMHAVSPWISFASVHMCSENIFWTTANWPRRFSPHRKHSVIVLSAAFFNDSMQIFLALGCRSGDETAFRFTMVGFTSVPSTSVPLALTHVTSKNRNKQYSGTHHDKGME